MVKNGNLQNIRPVYRHWIWLVAPFSVLLLAGLVSADKHQAESSSIIKPHIRESVANVYSIHSNVYANNLNIFITPMYNDFELFTPHSVLDKASGLIWQKDDDNTMRDWEDAQAYCESLRLDDKTWRLPTRAELLSLVDFDRTKPSIDTDFFPTTKNFNYWASTPYTGTPEHAWSILFSEGNAYCFLRVLKTYTRCVRNYEAS